MSIDNTFTITGNLTADPELGVAANGTPYARFTIAATPRRYDKNSGDWADGETLFLRSVAWRELADHVNDSLTKGTRVIATGTLRQSNWTTDEGEKRSAVDLHVDEIGPSLRFATAKVAKAVRGDGRPEPTDPWAPQTHPTPATASAGVPGFTDNNGSGSYDEPPF